MTMRVDAAMALRAGSPGYYPPARLADAQMYQVLNERGELVGEMDVPVGMLVDIFRAMVRTRAFDRRATALRRQGRIGEYYGCAGQDALAAAALAMGPNDWLFSAFRDQPAWFARGLPFDAVLEAWMGLPAENWNSDRYRITRMNATIGTHLPHAVGFTHAKRLDGDPVSALVVFGDGGTSEADFHSGLNFAGVWKTPTVFLCQNNQYAQSVSLPFQTAGAIASKASGYGIPGVRVDGMDPVAMYMATQAAFDRAENGEGATLIEMVCYRYNGHATFESNPLPYRPAGEPESWMAKDPIDRLRTFLLERELVVEADEQTWIEEVQDACAAAMERLEGRSLPAMSTAVAHTYSAIPRAVVRHLNEVEADLGVEPTDFGDRIFEPAHETDLPDGPREQMTHVRAIRNAMFEAMEADDGMICIGEDIAADGGCFKATEGFLERFGPGRVIDSPLCETGIVGAAVGMAMAGHRVMAEMQLAGFVLPALDQLMGHVSRLRFRYQGERTAPILVRLPGGAGWPGLEFHTDSPEGLFLQAPGTFVIASSDPFDAKGLVAAALQQPDPVVLLEPVSLYRSQSMEVPTDHYTLPLGRAHIPHAGSDATIVTYGRHVGTSLKAAELAREAGVSVEVINLRTLRPWDQDTVISSVAKTGRLITVHDAPRAGGVGTEVAARVVEELMGSMLAPPIAVAGFDTNRPTLKSNSIVEITPAWILGAVLRATGEGR